jgi:hypothetical protein
MRVLVCGGRKFADIKFLRQELDKIHEVFPITCIIEGGAGGADYLSGCWSRQRGLKDHASFEADWDNWGKMAGPIRNQRMIDEGKPDYYVAFPGGPGTADMVRRLKKANIPGKVFK